MAGGQLRHVLCYIRSLAGTASAGDVSDRALLARFAADRDQAAFAELVRRHGPLVWGVCRRLLRHEQDAEDAFQATFLTLARGAGSIWAESSLGGWLYGVARRVALRARAQAEARYARERAYPGGPGAAAPDEAERRDLRAVLDEEVGRLP